MSSEEFFLLAAVSMIVLACVGGGCAFLLLKYAARRRAADARLCASGIDITSCRATLDRVRKDYASALHHYPHPKRHSRELLEFVRGSIGRLPYFHHRGEVCATTHSSIPGGSDQGSTPAMDALFPQKPPQSLFLSVASG